MRFMGLSGAVEYSRGRENYFLQNQAISAFNQRITRMYTTITTHNTSHMNESKTEKKCISKTALQILEYLFPCFHHSQHHNFQNEQHTSNQEKNQNFFKKSFFHVILLKFS